MKEIFNRTFGEKKFRRCFFACLILGLMASNFLACKMAMDDTFPVHNAVIESVEGDIVTVDVGGELFQFYGNGYTEGQSVIVVMNGDRVEHCF